jgi:hypothetical protein
MPPRRTARNKPPFVSLKAGEEVTVQLMQDPSFDKEPLSWANGRVYALDVNIEGEGPHVWVVHCDPEDEVELVDGLGLHAGDRVLLWRAACDPPRFEDGRQVLMTWAQKIEDDEPEAEPAPAPARRAAAPAKRARASAGRAATPRTTTHVPKTAAATPAAAQPAAKAAGPDVMARLIDVVPEFVQLAVDSVSHVPTGKKATEVGPVIEVVVTLLRMWGSLGFPETPAEYRRNRKLVVPADPEDDGGPDPDDPTEQDIPF